MVWQMVRDDLLLTLRKIDITKPEAFASEAR